MTRIQVNALTLYNHESRHRSGFGALRHPSETIELALFRQRYDTWLELTLQWGVRIGFGLGQMRAMYSVWSSDEVENCFNVG